MENFIIDLNDKFYPEADEWMWNYCIFLGKFTDSSGSNWDLGILLDGDSIIINDWSAAIVYDNNPGAYISGGYHNMENEKKRIYVRND